MSNGKWYDVRFDEIGRLLKDKGFCVNKWLLPLQDGFKINESLHHFVRTDFKTCDNSKFASSSFGQNIQDKWKKCWNNLVKLASLVNEFLGETVVGLNMAESTLQHVDAWIILLKKNKPKVIFIENYYYPKNLALILAAHELGVSVVDVAHGKQGNYHGMYSHWVHPSLSQSPVLPDFFWVWGEESARNINRWGGLSAFAGVGPALAGGNPSLGSLKDLNLCKETYKNSFNRINFKNQNKEQRLALISMQHKWSSLPEFMFELMKDLSNWKWILRLHPVLSDITEQEGNSLLKEKGIRNSTVSNSREIPLPLILNAVELHLTSWSSVCYEALALGKPTIFFGAEAKVLYAKYIQEGYFSYGNSLEEVKLLIGSIVNNPVKKEKEAYLLTDPASANKTLSFITENI